MALLVVCLPSGTLFLPLQATYGHDLYVVLAALPLHWAGRASPASSWTRNALAGNNSYHTTKMTHERTKYAALRHSERRCWYLNIR